MEIIAKVKSNTTSTRSLRSSAGVLADNKLGDVAPDVEMDAIGFVVATKLGEFSSETRVGDVWWEVIDVRTKQHPNDLQRGHVAGIHKGETLLTVTLVEEPDPDPEPEPEPEPIPSEFSVMIDHYQDVKRLVITTSQPIDEVLLNGEPIFPASEG